MLQQYYSAKASHPEALIAMRVGDFYEFYGEDAETAARILEITLTGREDGSNGRIPMAGVPFHSVDKYLARLVQAGQKVALMDQVEDPKLAKNKLVKREVTRVLSAGTLVEESLLAGSGNSYLAAICVVNGRAGLASLDPSTGEFMVTEIEGERLEEKILQELARIRPAELVAPEDHEATAAKAGAGLGLIHTPREPDPPARAASRLLQHFETATLSGFGLEGREAAVVAAGMVLDYAGASGLKLGHVDTLTTYSVEGFMSLDPATRRSLELTQNMMDGSRRHSLFSVLDFTRTPMGSRLLRRWIEQPLLEKKEIERRLGAVARLLEHVITRGDLRDALKKLGDLERLVSRCAAGVATPRDLSGLKNTLLALPALDEILRKVALEKLFELRSQLGDHRELALLLHQAVMDDPPLTVRDGGIFKAGYDPELDKLRELQKSGRSFIAALEAKEKQATGLDKLKVGFNSVFGYYLEVPKSQIDRVPDSYIRKQTTANAERYITAELKDHESAVLGAEEKMIALEGELFVQLRDRVAGDAKGLLQTARAIAELDALAGLAESAFANDYVRPELVDDDVVDIRGGRHPVVESGGALFVPNDLELGEGRRLMILTGPNMSGKSTYLRQTALIQLMAQIGSFVPARGAKLGLCDRIFTRIGAKDELAQGQSTFMVEMIESANILNNATHRSLVILDEVGRGTSTYDGLAIAWAMVEHLAGVGAKVLFATHYHQLNTIENQIVTVFNCRVAVEEKGDEVYWTHKVLPGGTDRSYGIQVARMAGVPPRVLSRAAEVLGTLEDRERAPRAVGPSLQNVQLTLFEMEESEVVKELRDLDVSRLTPLEALVKLDQLKKRV
jgi:DNA mismatch repair protein MutS